MTIWQQSKPRWQYNDISYSVLSGTTTGTEVLAWSFYRDALVYSFVNNSDKEITVLFTNPEDPNKEKFVYCKIAPGFGFGSASLNSGGVFHITAGTVMYVHANSAAVTAGNFKIFAWG
jgi:hypothetical protein